MEDFLLGIPLWQMYKHLPEIAMLVLSLLLIYLAIGKKYEPFLLLPLGFGMLLANLPVPEILGIPGFSAYDEGGLLHFLYKGIKLGIYPPMIFLCLGAMTDFGPLLSRPSSAFIGLGGQLGIFTAFGLAFLLMKLFPAVMFDRETLAVLEASDKDSYNKALLAIAAVIGIVGSSDGPTTIFTASTLAPEILPTVAIAAYSYMALVPIIQPPIMRMLTTPKERAIVMPEPKRITQKQKIIFPIAMTIACILIFPAAGTLIAMLMLGNLIKESGVVERYLPTLQTALLNILTILIGISIGATATADMFLQPKTLIVIGLGLLAFAFGTVGGVLVAKILCAATGGKVNPLIGNSGVSAMPMAARVSQKLGQEYNSNNHLIMHAMGPIVASTIGSAMVAGIFIALFGK